MQPDVSALASCCRASMDARNGHGRRWAVERCMRALQAPEVPAASPAVDELAARAMVAVAGVIRRRASAAAAA